MCGIIAAIGEFNSSTVDGALGQIHHRGPDGRGIWADQDRHIILGHVRLSILDLSEAGSQPMHSRSGRYAVVFNGEIYNHNDLRKQLQNVRWRGSSDTETLVEYIEEFGIVETLGRARGMFAIALWDKVNNSLTIARDRFGEKPLYYYDAHNCIVASSELTPIEKVCNKRFGINHEAAAQIITNGYVKGTSSIFLGIKKLAPGAIATFQFDRRTRQIQKTMALFWDSSKEARKARLKSTKPDSINTSVEKFQELFDDIISEQMISDVPLGAFLSGGIDSSLVVATMARLGARTNTFSIGFSEDSFNEATFARQVAEILGTNHTEAILSEKDALSVIPALPVIYSEPFADVSQLPTILVARVARQKVAVALSGDAGDELFCGYDRYAAAESSWGWLRNVPLFVRRQIAINLLRAKPSEWDRILHAMKISRVAGIEVSGDRIHKATALAMSANPDDMYRLMTQFWGESAPPIKSLFDSSARMIAPSEFSLSEKMMLWDTLDYLPDDILVKVDRAAMSSSLETRVPFLDPRMFEFAWNLPREHKRIGNNGKRVLREALYRLVPQSLVDRPKRGFGVPIGSWLRGSLKEWGDDLINSTFPVECEILDPCLVRQKWKEHQSGQRNWQYGIWACLVLLQWAQARKA